VSTELSCREVVELVTAYLDNALPPSEHERFERHLSVCPGCVTYVDQIRETVRLTGAQPREEALTPDARDALLAQFRNWQEESA
jgi:anti-sigma factor RsiW